MSAASTREKGRTIPPEHRDFHRRWSTLKPPLRPHPNVAAAIKRLLPETDKPVLLLGVTPELAVVPQRTIAVDWSERMIAVAWPGDDESRKAVLGDWRSLPLETGSVGAAIGDGSITMLNFPEDTLALLHQLRRVIEPQGRAIVRCFATPEEGETIEAVYEAALSGNCAFHAFKLRFYMAAAIEAGLQSMPCEEVFHRFQQVFPDREALSKASGWSLDTIAEIDAYRASSYVQSYPSRSQLLGLMPDWLAKAELVETEGYPLAERCPLLVIDFP